MHARSCVSVCVCVCACVRKSVCVIVCVCAWVCTREWASRHCIEKDVQPALLRISSVYLKKVMSHLNPPCGITYVTCDIHLKRDTLLRIGSVCVCVRTYTYTHT